MKKLFVLIVIVAGIFTIQPASAQVRINVGFERDYPGYTYYTYPAWHGHYRDRYYYAHYRPAFEKENKGYLRGRRFERERFERDYRHDNGRWQRRH